MTYAEKVRSLLDYDPNTGLFVWRKRTVCDFPSERAFSGFKRFIGTVAGSIREDGYVLILVFGKHQYAHRLAWLVSTGEWPTETIDRIDGNPTNNRLANLRQVDSQENSKNASISKRNKSGHIGVHFASCANKWTAQVRVGNKPKHLGFFASKEDAIRAREEANIQFGFHQNHGRSKSEVA